MNNNYCRPRTRPSWSRDVNGELAPRRGDRRWRHAHSIAPCRPPGTVSDRTRDTRRSVPRVFGVRIRQSYASPAWRGRLPERARISPGPHLGTYASASVQRLALMSFVRRYGRSSCSGYEPPLRECATGLHRRALCSNAVTPPAAAGPHWASPRHTARESTKLVAPAWRRGPARRGLLGGSAARPRLRRTGGAR